MIDERIVDMVLLAFLTLTALTVVRLRNLFATAMLTGIFSLLGACWMLFLDAPDVAFTEAAVGAGISTVLLLATLCVTPSEEKPTPESPLAMLVVIVTGSVLVYATLDMPPYGDPEAPAHTNPVTHAYIASAKVPEAHGNPHGGKTDGVEAFAVGIPNTVTTVLASFRGYDTMGETAVIFTAGFGVVLILSGARRRGFEGEGDPSEDETTS